MFPNIFAVFLMGLPGELGGFVGPWSNMKHSSITALPEAPRNVQLSQVYPFHLPPYRRWDYIYQLWPTLLPGGPLQDSGFSGNYTILSLGVKVRLQHLSVWLLRSAVCSRAVLKLLVCSSCCSVWFHSRSEISVWGPQGSPPSLAGGLKQQELDLPSFSKAEPCVNPYLSITNSSSNPLAHIASSVWLCIFVPFIT